MTETWAPPGVASSGAQVTLTWTLGVLVQASDERVALVPATIPGTGVPPTVVTSATVGGQLGETHVADATIDADP
jgi:hypothetical protein